MVRGCMAAIHEDAVVSIRNGYDTRRIGSKGIPSYAISGGRTCDAQTIAMISRDDVAIHCIAATDDVAGTVSHPDPKLR